MFRNYNGNIDWFLVVTGFMLLLIVFVLVVVLPITLVFDNVARNACLVEGYDGGYMANIWGYKVCFNEVQESATEYFRLE